MAQGRSGQPDQQDGNLVEEAQKWWGLHRKVDEELRDEVRTKVQLYVELTMRSFNRALNKGATDIDLKSLVEKGVPGGYQITEEDLYRVLVLVLRDGDILKSMPEIWDFSWDFPGKELIENSLAKAWRTIQALRLPLSPKDLEEALGTLHDARYDLSRHQANDRSGDQKEQWRQLCDRVDQLLHYTVKLEKKLHEEVDDEALFLAKISVLVLRDVKRGLRATYNTVPWNEVEYFLVSFVKSHVMYKTWAFIVTTRERMLQYLRSFKQCLKNLKAELAGKDESHATGYSKFPLKSMPTDGDNFPANIVQDSAVLKDYESLECINDHLSVAVKALERKGVEWENRGSLELQRALLVVGERMKDSWDSPNLSARYTDLMEAMAPECALVNLKRIRDALAHAAEAHGTVLSCTDSQRERLRNDLLKVRLAVRTLLVAAERDLITKFCMHSGTAAPAKFDRAKAQLLDYEKLSEDPLFDRVYRIVKAIPAEKISDVDKVRLRFMEKGRELRQHKQEALKTMRTKYLFAAFVGRNNNNGFDYKSFCIDTLYHMRLHSFLSNIPEANNTKCLQQHKLEQRADALADFRVSLKKTDASKSDVNFKHAVGVVENLQITDQSCEPALLGALRIIASSWHEKDDPKPITELFTPVLFGKRLRNYMNHGDAFLDVCFSTRNELLQLVTSFQEDKKTREEKEERKKLTGVTFVDFESQIDLVMGAQPRNTDQQEVDAEHQRLESLVHHKCEVFRCAQLGNLTGLYDGVPSVDIASRDPQDRTLLHAAAESGSADVVRWLLALGPKAVDPSAIDWLGQTALHVALTADVARLLLKAGLNVNLGDTNGKTPLISAVRQGREDVVRALLATPGCVLSATDNDGCTALHWAAVVGQVKVLSVLLKATGPQGGAHAGRDDGCGPSLLALAVSGGSAGAVKYLLGPTVEVQWSYYEWVEALRLAAVDGEEEVFKVLLWQMDHLCKLTATDTMAVAKCVVQGASMKNFNMFITLIPPRERGASKMLIEFAAYKGSEHCLQYLLNALVDAQKSLEDIAPGALLTAALSGRRRNVEIILKQLQLGKLIQDGVLEVALYQAAQAGHEDVVKLLIDVGASKDFTHLSPYATKLLGSWKGSSTSGSDITAVTHHHVNVLGDKKCKPLFLGCPLYAAAAFGHSHVVHCLREHGARLFDKSIPERTALHAAALSGHRHIAQDLLQKVKTDTKDAKKKQQQLLDLIEHRDKAGRTALYDAVSSGSGAVVKYLLRREEELLQPRYSKIKNNTKKGVCSWAGISVYGVVEKSVAGVPASPLDLCVYRCGSREIAETLLMFMDRDTFRNLAGLHVKQVLLLVQDTLSRAVAMGPDAYNMCRVLSSWIIKTVENRKVDVEWRLFPLIKTPLQ